MAQAGLAGRQRHQHAGHRQALGVQQGQRAVGQLQRREAGVVGAELAVAGQVQHVVAGQGGAQRGLGGVGAVDHPGRAAQAVGHRLQFGGHMRQVAVGMAHHQRTVRRAGRHRAAGQPQRGAGSHADLVLLRQPGLAVVQRGEGQVVQAAVGHHHHAGTALHQRRHARPHQPVQGLQVRLHPRQQQRGMGLQGRAGVALAVDLEAQAGQACVQPRRRLQVVAHRLTRGHHGQHLVVQQVEGDQRGVGRQGGLQRGGVERRRGAGWAGGGAGLPCRRLQLGTQVGLQQGLLQCGDAAGQWLQWRVAFGHRQAPLVPRPLQLLAQRVQRGVGRRGRAVLHAQRQGACAALLHQGQQCSGAVTGLQGQPHQQVMRLFGLRADGGAEAVALQRHAAAVDQRQRGAQVLPRQRGVALACGQAAQALVARQFHCAQAQCLRLLQRALQAVLRLVGQAQGGGGFGGGGVGLQQPACHAAAGQGGAGAGGAVQRIGRAAGAQLGAGQRQVGQRHRGRIALGLEQLPRLGQAAQGGVGAAQAQQGAGAVQRGAGLLHRRADLQRPRLHLLVQRHRLGQQVDGAVGIGQRRLGLDALLRAGTGGGKAAAGGGQRAQGGVVVAAVQFDAADGPVGQRSGHRQAVGVGAHAGAAVDAHGLVEIRQPGQRVGQRDVGVDGQAAVARTGAAHRRAAEQPGGVGVAVLPGGQRAQVDLDLAGGQLVAQGHELLQRVEPAAHGGVMLAQQRQRHHLGHAGLRRVLRLPQRAEGGVGGVEAGAGGVGVPFAEVGDALHPVRHGGDFGLRRGGRRGRLGLQRRQQRGAAHGAGWRGAPGGKAHRLQRPGQCQRVHPQRLRQATRGVGHQVIGQQIGQTVHAVRRWSGRGHGAWGREGPPRGGRAAAIRPGPAGRTGRSRCPSRCPAAAGGRGRRAPVRS